ncbi:alpha/beta-hydrolase [Amanita muscaria]
MSSTSANLDDFFSVFDAKTCVRRGLCPVTKIRPQGPELLESHSLYFEQHGNGKNKIVSLMGLNSSSFSWLYQVRYFGASGFKNERREEEMKGPASALRSVIHAEDEEEDVDQDGGYTILVFDNRGVGNSSTPVGPYSTSAMAEDVITLLDYVGWTEDRDLHVVSVSLGGMIAQELAYRIPNRIVSLILGVTTPGGYPWNNLPPLSGMRSLAKLTFTPEVDKKAEIALPMVYPVKWMKEKAEDDPQGRTNFEVEVESFVNRVSVTRKQQFMGHFSQMAAGLTHCVQPERLRQISQTIPKVTIVTGDEDNLIRLHNSYRLKEAMPEAELVQFKETGHGLHTQRKREFNKLIQRTIREGGERLAKGWSADVEQSS